MGEGSEAAPAAVITLDGPAGSGKSTTAREVACRLGFRHLDSGALYRALTYLLLREGIREEEWEALDSARLSAIDLRLEREGPGFRVLLEGEPLEEVLRSPEITGLVPALARIPAVRARLLTLQRSAPAFGGIVADGRDMGTVVFPMAPLKVFLTASLEERARRRLLQEGGGSDSGSVDETARRIRHRDEVDEGREAAPLRRPKGALVLDTTGLTFEEQVDRIVEAARQTPGLRLTGTAHSE
jgi:CMP/dCMP kinase